MANLRKRLLKTHLWLALSFKFAVVTFWRQINVSCDHQHRAWQQLQMTTISDEQSPTAAANLCFVALVARSAVVKISATFISERVARGSKRKVAAITIVVITTIIARVVAVG